MRTFFTVKGNGEVEERDMVAIDIVNEEYHISIRTTGILIKRKENGQWEEADDIQINLCN